MTYYKWPGKIKIRDYKFCSHVICTDLLKQGFMPKSEHRRVLFFCGKDIIMAFRVILLESETSLKVKLNNLIISKEGRDIWVPLDDISLIVLDNLSTSLTARLLCQLSENGIGLMLCNQSHLPSGYFSSYDNHSRSSKVFGCQLDKSKEFYDELWRKIVEVKIINQSEAYQYLKHDLTGAEQIVSFAKDIKLGDYSNREAHAAKIYFNLLMESSFSRGNDDIILNSALDYGYAVIRSYVARACVGYGLNTQLGIHHKSEYNRFNLVDDLMEPIRPFVDIVAYKIMSGNEFFTSEHRHQLVNILNSKITYDNKKMYFGNMIEEYVSQYASLLTGRGAEMEFPKIGKFAGEEFF